MNVAREDARIVHQRSPEKLPATIRVRRPGARRVVARGQAVVILDADGCELATGRVDEIGADFYCVKVWGEPK